ncbi:MAG: NUDIX domain-containing protein [Bacteroidales bacterium]|jgi:8-oxo-dGTP pyrophosphatase MutT (NUDIX family)|nr:NUDIX domain-containing protein [Bacteroidales bacterium]
MKLHKIDAAGGIVTNDRDEVLLIFRRGYWDFPKGKVEESESFPEAALREVSEETGLTSLRITSELISTFHTYIQNGQEILKQTYWFSMKSDKPEILIPQIEEEITEIRWVKREEVTEMLEESFETLKDLWGTIQ